jgi:subtilase family serine protease
MHRRASVITTVVISALTIGAPSLSGTAGAVASSPRGSVPSPATGCVTEKAGAVSCNSVRLSSLRLSSLRLTTTAPAFGKAASASVPPGYGPAQLQQAYNLTFASAFEGRTRTVAIVDAQDDPYALSDLSTYRSQFNLPPICGARTTWDCVTFTKVNEKGETSPLPDADPGWSQEISVDLDMVSAICPNCNILLVEADAATVQDLSKAEDTAIDANPVSIGNSWGTTEWNTQTTDDKHFVHPGIAITAAAGDYGYGVQWPASSPDVIAVGGTTLTPAPGSRRGWSETAWSGDGSGCSAVEPQPVWQSHVSTLKSVCAQRAMSDVAAVADPNTGVAVYDSYQLPGWVVFGGTSVSTQIISAVYGLAFWPNTSTGASALYAASPRNFFDVTSGSDGTCGSDLCTASVGWDGPTGLGTPNGPAAF